MEYFKDIENDTFVKIFLKSKYFSYKGNVYEKIHGVVIGSPLSLVVSNIYMDKFEVMDFNAFQLTLRVWK